MDFIMTCMNNFPFFIYFKNFMILKHFFTNENSYSQLEDARTQQVKADLIQLTSGSSS